MPCEEIKGCWGNLINEADTDKLQNLNHDPKLINDFKLMFDSCLQIPSKDSLDGTLGDSAVTLFLTTNYPYFLDPIFIYKSDIVISPLDRIKDLLESRKKEKMMLFSFERIGLISDKERNRLKHIKAQEQQEYNYLKQKEKSENLTIREMFIFNKIKESIEAEKFDNFDNDEED